MCQYSTAQFEKDLADLGISLSEKQLGQFIRYYEMLIKWNQAINLTTITEYNDVMKKHFVDSLSLVKTYDMGNPISAIDVGTGAGFPGIPLKIAFPGCRVTLLDSLNKRVQFLNAVIAALGLTDVEAVHGRAEDLAKPGRLRESFDLCVSRAVANMNVLSEYCLPFVKAGGFFIAYKSEKVSDEMAGAGHAVSVLGGKVEGKKEFLLPGSNISRCLIVVKKERMTPKKYPRKAGLPGKEPLHFD